MKQLRQTLLITLLLSMLGINAYGYDACVNGLLGIDAYAYDAYVNGIYYNLNGNEASVTYRYEFNTHPSYSGDVTIPSTITYKNKTYTVTHIGTSAFAQCKDLTSVTLPGSLVTIDYKAFEGCIKLSSILIPASVSSIGNEAFSGCTALTSVTVCSETVLNKEYFEETFGPQVKRYYIGTNVTKIKGAFVNCSEMTYVYIPNSVKIIGKQTFAGCTGLSSLTLPNSITDIGEYAFSGCTGLTTIEIPSGVKSLSNYVFYGCTNLSQITIPHNVTKIGIYSFAYCTSLTQITIPKSVNDLGYCAFLGCTELSQINVESGNVVYDSRNNCNAIIATSNDSLVYGCKNTVIPNGVKIIGKSAFAGCSGLTSVTIPESVTSIAFEAFEGTGLTTVYIPENVVEISSRAFACPNMTSITINSDSLVSKDGQWNTQKAEFVNTLGYVFSAKEVILGDKVTKIGNYKFRNCYDMTSISISNSVTSIGEYAFDGCRSLEEILIPESVTSIGLRAFYGSGISNVDLHDNIICSSGAFNADTYIWVNKGSKTLLSLWGGYSYPELVFQKGTEEKILKPSFSLVSATQTSLTLKLENKVEGYSYKYKSIEIDDEFDMELNNDNIFTVGYCFPEKEYNIPMQISKGDYSICIYSDWVTTKPITPICHFEVTATSINVKGSYSAGEAQVSAQYMYMKNPNVSVDGNTLTVSGLNPGTYYQVEYLIVVSYERGGKDFSRSYNTKSSCTTLPLTLTTLQPKVVSSGNVIVAAESNIDDAEKNVGFEWRRTDWSDDFASNSGAAYLYEGMMEGYIRNLNTEKLWKYRPYYVSDSGTYYYGEWIGLDPTNTSYFEPTVHTYANITVDGNSASIEGLTLPGSDGVASQGFQYWESTSGANEAMMAPAHAPAIPGNAKTVEVSGQVMTATLTGLNYGTTYNYVAFVKTTNGETFYGEVRSFTTEPGATGIYEITDGGSSSDGVHEVARYNLNGQPIDTPERGINIIRYSDGSTRKVVVK